MAHFLKKDEVESPRPMRKRWAFVTVQLRGKDVLEIVVPDGKEQSLFICKLGILVVDLPGRIKVLGEGKPIKPSPGRKFVVTVETFDPFHGLTECDSGD